MKLTSATLYALRALVHLARHGDKGPVPSQVMARAGGMSGPFLLKALQALAAARILHSLRGPGGGYHLARPAKAITLLDVVEAVEGPVRGEVPRVGISPEGRRLDARLQAACDRAAELIRERLRRASLADLAGE